ncbi:TetR/AcrR family transcriptional regulator [Neptunomonas sp.]|uniref:TetR/AcrR family transcriptional regulator n=1 Tax=Neptunomonas sp. TaxID=1971898 RepID=UPI0025CC26FC|nr:TetR/AcrR family transcriptional regulator [Neptunomonas sp.]
MTPRILDIKTQVERENTLLDCAHAFIQRESIAALTIDKLVKELPFSKGTIYNHFNSKEDILLGLCNRGMSILAELFNRARQFDGLPREQGLAIHFAYMLYAKLHPTLFMLVLTAKTSNITDKASASKQEEHLLLEGKLIGPIVSIFQESLDRNEISPPMPMTLEQLAFACWSLSFGTNALLLQNIEHCGTRSNLVVERELINNVNLLFDGFQFQPLTNDFDWTNTISRLKSITFCKEIDNLKSRGHILAI